MSAPRATGIGGVFLRAEDPRRLGEWHRRHLGIDLQEGRLAPARVSYRVTDLDAVNADPAGNRIELWRPPEGR